MIQRLFHVRNHEWRILALLGGYIFIMLAATTIMFTASEALFVDRFSAAELPYGIAAAQVAAILGFYVYRLIRRIFPARLVSPITIFCLIAGIAGLYAAFDVRPEVATFAFVVVIPLYQSVLGAEYGRMTAAQVDPRSARRLLPLLGAIGGAGATAGAELVGVLAGEFGTEQILMATGLLLALLIVPSMFMKDIMRPRSGSTDATLSDVLGNRFALILLLSGALIIALSTVVRTQFSAMVTSTYEGAEVTIYYGEFYKWLNAASIVFALFMTNWCLSRLGAGKALLLYPGLLGAVAAFGTQLFQFYVAPALQFIEKLFRQNVHNTAGTIVGMPLPVNVRVRLAMISSGVVKPAAVLLTSGLLLISFGEQTLLPRSLTWEELFWPAAVFSLLLLACSIYLTRHYGESLKSALHARRLQLEPDMADDEFVQALPMDEALEQTLLGYLSSELPERVGLALDLLAGQRSPEASAVVYRRWSELEPWLKLKAVAFIADQADPTSEAFLNQPHEDEPDAVRAELIRHTAASRPADGLWSMAQDPSETGLAALAELAHRSDPRVADMLDDIDAGLDDDQARRLATAVEHWPDDRYDAALPKLLPRAPEITLQAMAKRPNSDWAALCIPYLANEGTRAAAAQTLLMLGDQAVVPLETHAKEATSSSLSFSLLGQIEGTSAHLAGMRLMGADSRRTRSLASKARIRSHFELSAAEKTLIDENTRSALEQAERFHSYLLKSEGVMASVARTERDAALEDVFINLTLADRDGPYRQIHLGVGNPDSKQRAIALELLDEHVPNKLTNRLLPIVEDMPVQAKFDMGADRAWLELEQQLDTRVNDELTIRDLKQYPLFDQWRVSELDLLGGSSDDPTPILLRGADAVDLERILLTGQSTERRDGDRALPLASVYRAMRIAPRCGHLWLQALVDRIPAEAVAQTELTRSAMVSLASRAVVDDHDQAESQSVWARMFFLRSSELGQNLPAQRLKLLADISRSMTADAGQVVVHERRLGHHFYLLCTGRAQVSQGGKPVAELGPSDGFGALSLIQGTRRPMTVTLTEPSELIAISRIDFLDLLETHPELVRSFARNIANQILSLTG